MPTARCFLTLTFAVALLPLFAQFPEMRLPMLYADKHPPAENSEAAFAFLLYPFKGPVIDLRDVKKRYPKLDAPDSLRLTNIPDIRFYTDRVVLIGLIPDAPQTTDALVIWLGANYNSNRVTLWVDAETDHDFASGVDVVRLSPGDKARQLAVSSKNGHFKDQRLTFGLPTVIRSSIRRGTNKLIRGWTVGLAAGLATGKLNYSYFNTELGYPSGYDVKLTEKDVALSLSRNFRYLRLSANLTYANVNAYTSVLNVQVGEPQLRIDPNNGREFYVDRIDVRRNLDRHPTAQLRYSLTAAFRGHISPGIELQPFVSYGRISYRPGVYVARISGEENRFNLSGVSFGEFGLRAEFAIGNKQSVYVDGAYQVINWRPEGFFEFTPHTNLKVDRTALRVLFGYRFGGFRFNNK